MDRKKYPEVSVLSSKAVLSTRQGAVLHLHPQSAAALLAGEQAAQAESAAEQGLFGLWVTSCRMLAEPAAFPAQLRIQAGCCHQDFGVKSSSSLGTQIPWGVWQSPWDGPQLCS